MNQRPDGVTTVILCVFAGLITIFLILFFLEFLIGLVVGTLSSWWILRWLNGSYEEEEIADDRG